MGNEEQISQNYYDMLKEVVKKKYDLVVKEKKLSSPFKIKGKILYMNAKDDIHERTRWLNGLLIRGTAEDFFGIQSEKYFDLNDLNYVTKHLCTKYWEPLLTKDDIIPTNKENADKVLINLNFALNKAKEKLVL